MSGASAGAESPILSESLKGRLVSLVVILVCAAPLVTGWLLEPSPKGYGTHESLRLPPCGWLLVTGKPCMTCGMTTAVTLAVHGRIPEAFFAQPAGLVVAIVLASGLWLGVHSLLAGASPGPFLEELTRSRWVWAGAGLILAAAWAYKVVTF
ncbi:MAG: DUF2752 domain-containing protein [Phycisphaerales bacterium]|nr:DUF2752 domain-containing protein [Planctomycetota bacterium]